MSVLMHGVDMPKNCEECNFKGECRNYWDMIREAYTRPSWCPLEEIADTPQIDYKDGEDYLRGYKQGRIDALNELMEYTYGMLTAEKFGLQHKIRSMIWDAMKSADGRSVELVPNTNKRCQSVESVESDTPQTETLTNSEKLQSGVEVKQTDCPWK